MMGLPNQYHIAAAMTPNRPLSLKRSHSDMRSTSPPPAWVDESYYYNHVLRLPVGTTEDEVDRAIHQEAQDLGVHQLQIKTDVEGMTSSMSATTVASDPTNQSSIMSQSTAPTSCSSSEHRPPTRSTNLSEKIPHPLVIPSPILETDSRRKGSAFRNGIRKMTGFGRRRKSTNIHSPSSFVSLNSPSAFDLDGLLQLKDLSVGSLQTTDVQSIDGRNTNFPLRSSSTKSTKSLWSRRGSLGAKPTFIDHEGLKRSMECKEMVALRARQLEERQRFLDYRSQVMSDIVTRRQIARSQKMEPHECLLEEQIAKNEKAIEDLESRQLEDELKMRAEQERDKRNILARLRHMENYCQTPSPPPTPVETSFTIPPLPCLPLDTPTSARGSVDSMNSSILFHERKITDKDYYNLASSYRERDTMDSLHNAKINVLRGRQKRALESLVRKKEAELASIESNQQKELYLVDFEFSAQEAACRAEFQEKGRLLERRWKLQSMIERARQEQSTHMKNDLLPDVVTIEDAVASGLTSA